MNVFEKPEHKPMTQKLSRKEFTDLILGKKLTKEGILALLRKEHPSGKFITERALRHRLELLEQSPFADFKKTKKQGREIEYQLVSITPDFYKTNHKAAAANRARKYPQKVEKSAKPKYRMPLHPIEIQYCRVHQLFDQALASVQGGAKAARKFKATTNSRHNLLVAPNLLQQDFSATGPDQKYVGDAHAD